MNETSSRSSEKLDQLLVGISLLGILVFFYLLSDDSLFSGNRQEAEYLKIGSIQNLQKDVRRRFQGDFVWLPLNDLEKVYLGDAIFTGGRSTASISLDSGINLWIDPNSLVVLDQISDLMKLDLRFGNVRGTLGNQASAALKLNINNQYLDLAGNSVEFVISKSRTAETRLQVIKGVANVTESQSKRKMKVATDQGLKVGRGIASISNVISLSDEPLFVRHDQWAMHRSFWFVQKQPLRFTWQTEGTVDHFELIISRRSDLQEPLVKEVLKVNGFEWLPPFDEGSLFWKVRAFGKEPSTPVESDVILWDIGLLLAPEWKEVTNPFSVSSQELSADGPNGASKISLQWDTSLKSLLYRLEISQENAFLASRKFELNEKKWNLPKLPTGRYFVRVRSEGLGRPASLWSHPLILEISDQDPDGLVSPKVATLDIETLEKTGVPSLQWPAQDHSSGYLVEVASRSDFSTVLQSVKVKENAWMGLPKPLGEYYVRIFPLAESGRRGPVSRLVTWNSRVIGPQLKTNSNVLDIAIPRDKAGELLAFPKTLLQWNNRSSGRVSEYIVEKDVNSDFATKKQFKSKEPQSVLEGLTPGVYFYRIRNVYDDGSISLPSEVLKVEVFEQQADGLTPPNVLVKAFESKLSGDELAVINLKWEKLPTARKYKVEIAGDAEFKTNRTEKIVASESAALQMAVAGDFFLRVAGLSKSQRLGPWSQAVKWKITYGPPSLTPLSPITVTLKSVSSPVPPTSARITWKAPKHLNEFLLQISEDASFSKFVVNERVKGRSYRLPLSQQAKYKVRIKAVDEKGNNLTPTSKVMDLKFYINRPLPAPELLTPKDKVSYILSRMKNPQIWLEWSSDKLASGFRVEFAKDKKFNKILHTLTPKEKKILLDHNVIRGKLYWRVKALNDEQNLESPWSAVWSLSVVDIENED